MAQYDRIIDYVIEQADRYDIRNLQFEDDIKFELSRLTDMYYSRILNKVNINITSQLILAKTMMNIQYVFEQYVNHCKKVMMDKFEEYYDIAYQNTEDLISLGNEMMAKYSEISEQRANNEYDEETIKYIQQHAFELLKGHSHQKIERIRAELGDLFLRGKANKANVRSAIEEVLRVDRNKAEDIAQTELSRAYSYGTQTRLRDYQRTTGKPIEKYWHGFKYSENTCEYCRSRIGSVYALDDDTEELPAHVKCRCIWLPIMDGWDGPVDTKLISRANMLNTAYNKDMIYLRINNRLGINYADYMSDSAINDFTSGDRTEKVYNEMSKARERYIKDKMSSFDIARDASRTHMSAEFNQQMSFWKKYVAGAMADNDKETLDRSYEAIKGVMILPWNAEQLDKWNTLLGIISNFK